MREWRRDGDTVACRTDTRRVSGAGPPESLSDSRRPRLAVDVLSADAVRVRLSPDPEAVSADESPLGLSYDTLREPTALDVTETDDEVRAATEGLAVTVDRETAGLTVRDRARDRTLLATASQTDSRDRPVVPPTGFTESERGGWPLTVTETGLSVRLPPSERPFGLGEQFGGVCHRGDRVEARVRQPNGTGSRETYFPVPVYLSDRGYGVFLDTTADATFDFGATAPATTRLAVADSTLTAVVFRGDPATVLERYTELTGRPPEVPEWSLGVWWSRNSYESAAEVRAVADRLRDTGTPADLLHLDPGWTDTDAMDLTWDREAFPDPEGLLADLAADDFHVSVWEYPYPKVGTETFAEARDRGYLAEDGHGRPLVVRRPSRSDTRAGIVDFTDPDAVAWWRDRHHRLREQGVDVFKTDFGEYLPPEAVVSDGRTGRAAHNDYPVAYQRAVAGAFDDDTPLLWSRSGWAGAQRYPVHWGGDAAATEAGFAASVRGGLSLAASGVPLWSCDIGGYKPAPSPDLYRRWAQWGLLALSHPRFHGKTPREPWVFGEAVAATVRRYARLRYRLLPYLAHHARLASETGLPLLRPTHVARPDADVPVESLGHLVGDSLFVRPDTAPGEPLSLHLPDGDWINHWTGERVTGPARRRLSAPRSELPAFWAAGSLVAEQIPGPHVGACEADPLTLRAFPDDDGTATGAWVVDGRRRRAAVSVMDDRLAVRLPAGTDRTYRVVVEGATRPETVRVVRGEPAAEAEGGLGDAVAETPDDDTLTAADDGVRADTVGGDTPGETADDGDDTPGGTAVDGDDTVRGTAVVVRVDGTEP